MPNTAGNWPFTYPDGTTPLTPLRQRFQQLAQSVADALTGNKVVVLVTDATDRAAKFPSPTQGDVIFRADLGWREIYYGLYNSGTNPAGAVAAGWYPEAGALIRGRAQRSASATISNTTTRSSVTLAGDTTFARGGVTYSGTAGIIVPYSGDYDVQYDTSWQANSAGIRIASVFKNGVEIPETLTAAANAGSAGAYYSQRRILSLLAGDVITLGVAQNSGGTLDLLGSSSNGAPSGLSMWWKSKG